MNENKKYDLEDRLIDFSITASEIAEALPNTKFASHISGQMIRSSSSPALNYGEVQSAESRNDFIHKVKIILKELRETRIALKIIDKKKLFANQTEKLKSVTDECNQLIAIFVKSVDTANKNRSEKK
ncbi:MAG: four helix bundle protein [Bacteroidia bacterium]